MRMTDNEFGVVSQKLIHVIGDHLHGVRPCERRTEKISCRRRSTCRMQHIRMNIYIHTEQANITYVVYLGRTPRDNATTGNSILHIYHS